MGGNRARIGKRSWTTGTNDTSGHPGPVWDTTQERVLRSGEFHGARRGTARHAGLTLADVDYEPGHRLPEHAHEHPFFCLLVHGSFEESLGRTTRQCTPATLLFYPEHEPHREEFGTEGGRAFNVELGAPWLGRMRHEGLTYRSGSIESRGGRLNLLMAKLHAWFLSEGPDVGAEEYVLELLTEVGAQARLGHEGRPPAWLTRVRDLVHERCCDSLRVTELADEAGVHPVHLARVFRRFHGCTIGSYIRMLRVERARTQLADPGRPLASIAFAAGFSDQAHLTRCFKELLGVPPGAYRRLLAG